MRGVFIMAAFLLLPHSHATAETCSDRANLCLDSCTPQKVAPGAQHGGTVAGCRASCQSRLKSCLRTGIWIHMRSLTQREHQQVEKR
jgi:hypothetical protein